MKKLVLLITGLFFLNMCLFAQNKTDGKEIKKNIQVELQEGAEPDIYVNGKKFDFPMSIIDKNQIESVNVVKGEKAIKEYNAPNGVVLIKTKGSSDVTFKWNKEKEQLSSDKDPMVIIDGKLSTEAELNKLDSDKIESIEVVKGEQAMKKYKAENGVIIIKLKKG